MKIHRIYAVSLRFWYYFRHSFDRMTDAFYWPTMDLLLWGLTSTYFRQYIPNNANVVTMIVTGILLYIILWRGQYEITVNLLGDLWNRNLINIFASPLKFWEWITSFMVIGIIKAILSIAFASGVAYLLYKVNFFMYGFNLIPFLILLIMSGWWIGFFVAGVILRFGTKVQTLAWAFVAIFSPFIAVYYPLSVLPAWAQKVASFIPMSYIFEGAREVLYKGSLDYRKLWISLFLNIMYLIISLIFLRKSFDKVLEKGLVKVY